jgi:hypothetical protein
MGITAVLHPRSDSPTKKPSAWDGFLPFGTPINHTPSGPIREELEVWITGLDAAVANAAFIALGGWMLRLATLLFIALGMDAEVCNAAFHRVGGWMLDA